MNKLPHAKRVQILSMLVEGPSMRSISRIADVSINNVAKMLDEAGEACAGYYHRIVLGVTSIRVRCEEIWAFFYAKKKNVETAKAAPEDAGGIWTWTVSLYTVWCNFVGQRKTLRCSPAMAAGLNKTLWGMDDIIVLIWCPRRGAKAASDV